MDNFFRSEALDHQHHKLTGHVILRYPRLYNIITLVIFAILLAVLGYIYLGKVNKKAEVVGYLNPSQGVMRYTAPINARVNQISVKANTFVEAGTPLIELVAEHHISSENELHQFRQHELLQRKQHFEKQVQLLQQQKHEKLQELLAQAEALTEQLARLDAYRRIAQMRLNLAQEKHKNLLKLGKQGAIAKAEIDQHQSLVLEHQATLAQLGQQKADLQAKQVENQHAQAHLPTQFAQNHEQLSVELSRLNSESFDIDSQKSYWLTASTSGKVTHIYPHLGDQVTLGMPLLNLLPQESELEAVLLIPSESIGFVKTGQDAKLKLDAFPYTRFGFQKAQIEEITEHVLLPNELNAPVEILKPAYRVRAHLPDTTLVAYGHKVQLKPGMTFKADVLLDEHPIWMWLFEPILSLRGHI